MNFNEYAKILSYSPICTDLNAESASWSARIHHYKQELIEQLSEAIDEFNITKDPSAILVELDNIQDILSALKTLQMPIEDDSTVTIAHRLVEKHRSNIDNSHVE